MKQCNNCPSKDECKILGMMKAFKRLYDVNVDKYVCPYAPVQPKKRDFKLKPEDYPYVSTTVKRIIDNQIWN
jgi:hypothetical protein